MIEIPICAFKLFLAICFPSYTQHLSCPAFDLQFCWRCDRKCFSKHLPYKHRWM